VSAECCYSTSHKITHDTSPRILAFGGSLRLDSFNQQLATVAAGGAREAGAEVTVIALRDFPLPVFDQDLEAAEGMPEAAKKLKQLFREHHGLIIAAAEYNSSITAALKNALDWVSRAETDDEPPLSAFTKDGRTSENSGARSMAIAATAASSWATTVLSLTMAAERSEARSEYK
jgi:NAD(P)H-dependent FMN reductase